MKVTVLEEPDLEFFAGARHVDPRQGIAHYGPADAAEDRTRTIRVALVGSRSAIDGLHGWLDRCRRPIAAKPSGLRRLFVPFPGFETTDAFRSTLVFNSRLERPLRDRELERLRGLAPERATRGAIDLYLEELSTLEEEPGCDLVLIARPDWLVDRAATPPDPARPWLKPRVEGGSDFRAVLKAEAMQFGVPLQVIRRSTWDPSFREPQSSNRGRQDEATRAWNLHTALYYKAGGVPWRLPRESTDLTTCFVGVAFYRGAEVAPAGATTSARKQAGTLQTSVAQVFNQRGDGVIVRGGPASVRREDRQPHLSQPDARALLRESLRRYRAEHQTLPARVVLHKTSSFTPEEIAGFNEAAEDAMLTSLELVWLPQRDSVRLFRSGTYPPLRGTLAELSADRHLLYTRGSVPTYGTYPGPHIPVPLPFRLAQAESSPEAIGQELLALTKMNWNQTQLDGKMPITLRTADQIGDILRHLPPDAKPQARYAFYM